MRLGTESRVKHWLVVAWAVICSELGHPVLGAPAADRPGAVHVREIDGAWWFVRPSGEPFFSSGVNVISPGPSRDAYDPKRPAYAAFRHYPDTASWAAAAHDRLRQWGFNTVGGWSAQEMSAGPLPYVNVLHVGAEFGVPWNDLLDPKFAEQVGDFVRERVKPRADDAHLLGWCTDNELGWFSDTLFSHHISQPSTQATRQALVRLLRRHYDDDFGRLEADFHPVDIASFDELERGGTLRLRAGGDAMQVANRFTAKLARHYYRTMHEAIRRYDANHLILGDRFHSYTPGVVAKAAGPYVDVVTTNYDWPDWTGGGLPVHYLQRLHELSGKPILVTEYYVAARQNRSGNKNSGDIFTMVETQADRARAVRNRVSTLASLPYVVGAHWFQYADEPTFGRRDDGEDYNFGLVDIDDRPYEELVEAFAETHARMASLHSASGATPAHELAKRTSIPPAPSGALDGLGPWDTQRALVRSGASGASIADLLACWDAQNLYVAIVGSRFIDGNAYPPQQPPAEGERLQWELMLDDRPAESLQIGFGVGETTEVSPPDFECRLQQRGMRYTVIARLPATTFGNEALKRGDRLTLRAVLADRQNGTKITWESELELGGAVGDAKSRLDRLPR